MPSLLRTDKEIIDIYDRNVDTVYYVCYSFMKNKPEAEDMVQETFLRLISTGKKFENERHERAWLIVTASNLCKNSLKRLWRREESLEENPNLTDMQTKQHNEVLEAILPCRRTTRPWSTCTTTRVTPEKRSPNSWAVPMPRCGPGWPGPENY